MLVVIQEDRGSCRANQALRSSRLRRTNPRTVERWRSAPADGKRRFRNWYRLAHSNESLLRSARGDLKVIRPTLARIPRKYTGDVLGVSGEGGRQNPRGDGTVGTERRGAIVYHSKKAVIGIINKIELMPCKMGRGHHRGK